MKDRETEGTKREGGKVRQKKGAGEGDIKREPKAVFYGEKGKKFVA